MPAQRISDFETWREGYGGAIVTVYVFGTTTKASIYTDEALTVAAANPQTLGTLNLGGRTFGKLAQPIYTAQAVSLDIDSTDQTGAIRPALTTLVAADASQATVQARAGSQDIQFRDILDRVVNAEDHGVFLPTSDPDASSATNTATLTAAIGVASANGGGDVVIPGGTFGFTQVTLSAGVRLVGQGHEATVLQSQTGDSVITVGGDEAGLAHIKIDGVDNQSGSVGLYAKAKDFIRLDDIEMKNFETGIHMQGGRKAQWHDVDIDGCGTGAKLHGDNDASGGADGDHFMFNEWDGGIVQNCTTAGVQFSYVDKRCWHNTIKNVGFESISGVALNINGARFTDLYGCWWTGCTTNFAVDDDDDTDAITENTVIGLFFRGGSLSGGAATLTGTCQDVVLEAMNISDVDFTLTSPTGNILVQDCIEDSDVTISGQGTKYTRWRRVNEGRSSGITTDATATNAWSIDVQPGQIGYLDARVLGNRRNGTTIAQYHRVAKISRPGSSSAYENQTANFTVGGVLTGGTSGATARITADSDSGATGTLTLRDIVGTFADGETITDGSGGSADVNGSLSSGGNAVIDQADTLGTDHEDVTGWNAAFAVNGTKIELQVTGAASTTIEWVVDVKAVLS